MIPRPLRYRLLRHAGLLTAAAVLSVALLFLATVAQTVWRYAGLDLGSVRVTSKGLVFTPRPLNLQPTPVRDETVTVPTSPENIGTDSPLGNLWEGDLDWTSAEWNGSCCAYTDDDGNIVVCFSCLIDNALLSLQYIMLLAVISWFVISGNFVHHYRYVRAWWGTRHQYQNVGAGSLMLWLAELIFTSDEIGHNLLPLAQDARIDIEREPRKAAAIRFRMYAWALMSATMLIGERLLRPILRTLR